MGKLVLKQEIKNADWYFTDAYYSSLGGVESRWRYEWPNPSFPNRAAIHSDEMGDNKPAIRKWIEQTDIGTVICEYVTKSYRVWWSSDKKWDKTSEISNCWYVFHFEDSETALAFTLQFSNLVRPVTEDHPTKHHGERYHH